MPPTPLIPPRSLVSGEKRIGTRTPDPIIREDSRTKDDSLSFAPNPDTSASWTILPTTVVVSWHGVNYMRSRVRETDLCGSAWISKLVNMIVSLNEISKFINAIIQS